MIIRDAMVGTRTFSEFEKSLGASKSVLADRLSILVAEGVLRKEKSKPSVERYSYELTPKGRALFPIVAGMIQWSNKWIFDAHTEPYRIVDRVTGAAAQPIELISRQGRVLEIDDVEYATGPSAAKD